LPFQFAFRQKISQHFARKVLGLPTNDKNNSNRRKRFRTISLKKNATGENWRRVQRMMRTILFIILIILLLGALPTWPYSGGWGYYPSGGLGLILLIVIILAVVGRI
jgi:Protein of unknown function (DUF3309)